MDDNRTPTALEKDQEFSPLRLRLQPGDHVIDLNTPNVLLGRQGDADLRMPQPDVSRQHCRFQFNDGHWQVVDLDSLNGVFVNGGRIRQVTVIHPGDNVRICGVEFDVEGPIEQVEADCPAQVAGTIGDTLPQPTLHRRAS